MSAVVQPVMKVVKAVTDPVVKLILPSAPSAPGQPPPDPRIAAFLASQAKDKTAADKVIAEKETADIESKKKATALRKRRKATYPYKTAGGEAGLLSGAPVLLKSLLGG